MTRSRSALARHRQRALHEATLHVSDESELGAIAEIAGAASLAQLRISGDDDDDAAAIVPQAIRVLRNVKNSVYHRAMAARALGLFMLRDKAFVPRLSLEREELLDALLQLVHCCRRLDAHNADTRRVHVNCCLVISMLMQTAPQPRLQLVVALDSELLAMPPRPTDRESAFLLLTVSGRPETSVNDSANGSIENERKPLQPLRSVVRPPLPPNRTKPSPVKAKAVPVKPPTLPPYVSAPRDEDTSLAPLIERHQTPNRQFKMDRFRVITPALVPSASDQTRKTPLPVIPPSRHQLRDADVSSPNQLESSPRPDATPPPPSSTLLQPHHMVEILRSGRMPVASTEYFQSHLRDGDPSVRRTETPSRIKVVEWGEWRRRGLTTADDVGDRLDENTLEVPSGTPTLVARTTVDNIHTPEYKRERLRDILSSPIEPFESNTAQLLALERRDSTATMRALGTALHHVRDDEARTRQQTRSLIEQERDKLPLKFLFQLPGGAAYCRDRMRRAMLLWILEFEANQKRLALLQWKANVEQWRFRQRGQAYHRLAIEKRLRVAIEYVLRGFQQQAFRKWVESVQLSIWTDRDAAVRKIQRQVRRRAGLQRFLRWHDAFPVGGPYLRDVYLALARDVLFRVPVRVRDDRRRIWFAAELVQGVYRKRRFRKFLLRYRIAATKIQARARMRIHRAQYRRTKRRIIVFQAWVRMQRHYRAYQSLRSAAVLVQINFRSMRIKRLRKLIAKAQRRGVEWRLTAALRIQRTVRGFLGRCDARRRRRERDERFHAALVVQRAWYRRNNEWSTFLLLGCLREQETEELAFDQRVLAFKRTHMAKQIQDAWQRHNVQTRARAAAFVQRNVRRWIATTLVSRMRRELMAHRRIKWFFRLRHAHRVATAWKLQLWWLRAVPGRLRAHIHHLRLVTEATRRRETYFREERAATRIQSAARGRRDRLFARKERAARVLQKAARAFITWRRVKREIRRIKAAFAAHQAQQWIAIAVGYVFTAKMARLDRAATHIQRFARGLLWRTRLTRLLVESELRERMAVRIQTRWRQNAQARLAKRVLSAQRRRRENPFRTVESIARILGEMKARSTVFYAPDDELQGLHVAVWLKRLGMNEEQYFPLFQKLGNDDIDALTQLRGSGSSDDCLRRLSRLGVSDDDAEIMTTNLFAAQTLGHVRQLRSRLETLVHVQREEDKRGAYAQQQLRHAIQAKQELEDQLEEVLSEAAEFRNAPKALRDKREKLATQLDRANSNVASAKQKCDAVDKRVVERTREMLRLQNELSNLDHDEVSAVYSLQNFRLVRQLSVAGELFLSKFPGLEARALTFVGALREDQVSTWQLLKFFQSNATISQVKASMPLLTYFKYETDVKKHDHARFQACSDILQFGFERLGELLSVPVDDMVLQRLGNNDAFLPALVLQTIHAAHRCRQPKERALQWIKGTQLIAEMNAVATRVQSHWRRRAANRVMQLLRSTRVKQQLRDAYLTEVNADYVTPIWQHERDQEKEEYDQWLRDEELAAREEALQATLRFPWQEEWDDASQRWLIYRVSPAICGDQGPQYEYANERPVYSVAEEDAAIQIQSLVRRFIARVELHERRRQQRRDVKRLAMERQWQSMAAERSQTMTLRLHIQVTPDERVALWLGQRQHRVDEKRKQDAAITALGRGKTMTKIPSSVSPTTRKRRNAVEMEEQERQNVKNAEAVATFEDKLSHTSVVQQCEAAYHRSVRSDHRRHALFRTTARPPNIHAQAMLDFLEATQTLERSLARHVHTTASLRYTRVALPFGWREVPAVFPDERPYYYHAPTQATSWDRPQYDFAAEFAAIKIQSLARVALAWAERARTLSAISFVSTVHDTLERAVRIGWIGFGLEGISPAVMLSRLGLGKYATTALASLSLNDLLRLSEPKMKKLGMTKDEMTTLKTSVPPRIPQSKRTFPLSTAQSISLAPTVKHAFNFLPSERVVHQLVAQSLPNQQGRVLGLGRAVVQSTTPITYRQLEMHLRLYAGRPDDAVVHIDDIASLAYATQSTHEAQILALFLSCLERCIVFAANLHLRALHEEVSVVLQTAAALLRDRKTNGEENESDASVLASQATPLARTTNADAVTSLVAATRRRCIERPMKGLWESDASATASAAQVALFVRERGLERVLQWWRSAALTQATFRMHRIRTWYRAVVAHRRASAIVVQSAWRVYGACEFRRLLESQQRSPYEQQYDKLTKTFFFVYTPTREKLLDEPRDADGAMLPYRPMVQDRTTKRWMLAWPHYKTADARENRQQVDRDDDDWARDAPRCSVCHVERAVRRCRECVAPSGDYIDACLACFFDTHAPGSDVAWHTFVPLHALRHDAPRAFHCVECKRFSTMRCLACREHYCERCFGRVHRKGHTRARHIVEHYAPRAVICVECEANVAFFNCHVCQDALCEPCMVRTHARGSKQSHARDVIRQALDPESGHVYCEHCDARRGDATCSFCAKALCHVCLADATKHAAAACPETLLQLKKRELLGDRVCVECGKAADRACERCGDKYCSVKWMGNPGCFERFHWKGKRADHTCVPLEVDASKTPNASLEAEIRALEDLVKQKRRRDAEAAEQEARALAAALAEAAAADAKQKASPPKRRGQRKGASKRKLFGTAAARLVCGVDGCGRATVSAAVPFCSAHLTSQHALEMTKDDPLEAAKLLALVDKHGGTLPTDRGSTKNQSRWRRPWGGETKGTTPAATSEPVADTSKETMTHTTKASKTKKEKKAIESGSA